MRREVPPNKCNVGTRSNSNTSSSMDISPETGTDSRGCTRRPKAISRDQLIATGFRDQDLGIGSILLDLLPQTIDMRLQSVGGHARIVTPHFLQQRLARNRELARPVQKTQDCRLLLGKPHLLRIC